MFNEFIVFGSIYLPIHRNTLAVNFIDQPTLLFMPLHVNGIIDPMNIVSIPRDTTKDAQELLYDTLRKMSFSDKADLVDQINVDVTTLAIAGIKYAHPQYNDEQIKIELFRRRYGDEFTAEVFGQNFAR